MRVPKPWPWPAVWRETLQNRLTIDRLPPTKPYSQSRDFGWLTFEFPTQFFTSAPMHWYFEVVCGLRESLALLAVATAADKRHWKEIPGLDGYHIDELTPRYRFRVGSRVADVASLLDPRQRYSRSFEQTEACLRQQNPEQASKSEHVTVPVSLVIKPESWNPTMLNEIAALCELHSDGSNVNSVGAVTYKIQDVQLDLEDVAFDDTVVLALLLFLRRDVPLTKLCVKLEDSRWNPPEIVELVRAVDRRKVTSLRVSLESTMHYNTLTSALSKTVHLDAVELVMSEGHPGGVSSKIATTRISPGSAVRAVRWSATCGIDPQLHSDIQSLGLSMGRNRIAQLGKIGQQLQALQLYGQNNLHSTSIALKDVLRASPRIRCLELHGVCLDSLDALVDACDAGSSQLHSLALRQVGIHDIKSIHRLTTVLKDPNSRTARQLLEFVWIPQSGTVPSSIIAAFADVLDQNLRLRHLELMGAEATDAVDRLRCHHFNPILAYDHALFEVIDQQTPEAAITRVNDDVIRRIFEFANVQERRTVRIHVAGSNGPQDHKPKSDIRTRYTYK